jgi:hypothetical protein
MFSFRGSQRDSLASWLGSGLPPQTEILAPVVGHQDCAYVGITLEQIHSQPLFVGPRVGENDAEIVYGEPELLLRAALVRVQPGERLAAKSAGFGPSGNEAAAIQGMTGLVGGRVTKERDWTIDGNKGKDIEMSITGTPFFPVGWVASAGNKGKQVELPVNKAKAGFASSRMVVINNRLYQIVAIGEEATFDDADVKKFFDSFKLNQ